jgi:RNA polymerase sigma-70 factor, ECF subfamily
VSEPPPGRPGSGAGAPGDGAPGDGAPGDGAPAAGVPAAGVPGNGVPAAGVPGDGVPGAGDPATEAALIAAAQAGDVAAFERLSGAYADRLFMLLLRLLGDRTEAEDVAQEVMLRAWRGIGHFQGRSSYFTWLYRIAVNEASRALDRRARRPASVPLGPQELRLPASPGGDPARQAEIRELRMALARALSELPPPLRTAIVLRDIEGLSTQEAAEVAGVGQAAFKSRLHQARLRVRAAVGDQALATAGG